METIKKARKSLEDLSGQRFGMLTAFEYTGDRKWLCRCDCGNQSLVLAQNLKKGHTTSCGCKKQNDLTGKRIGTLTVLGRSDRYGSRGKRKTRLWECRCDCGEITYKATDTLTNPDTSMCGRCAEKYAAEKMRERAGYTGGTQISRIRSDKPPVTNTSGVRGVYYERKIGKWRARLKFKGKLMNFGIYASFDDAVKARKAAELEYFGAFLDETGDGETK